ncbi:hypothetical protein H1S01_03010 [Heliobacterium chlorum]|uniref:Uncharacterized protein n=1 Tax=Heliobacterium chlorum TaxID=2698 RepID=A0ABR7SZQ5_HELCL|nr:hypothetical protein [Heliobacterium chlorum]MBC9783480.1 hypothetical protein [Heliobacterium chlorum]
MNQRKRHTVTKELSIREITYRHDPEAAEKWFQLWVELLTRKLHSMPEEN